MNNILVIHPKDDTTDFLAQSYSQDLTVIRADVSASTLKSLIKHHDIIVMMGHGDARGLYGYGRHIIDSTFADHLRKKMCICIWCFASDFVEKYEIQSPFSTGMFISEELEAEHFRIPATSNQISDSNSDFAEVLWEQLKMLSKGNTNFSSMLEEITLEYIDMSKTMYPVKSYNVERFYSNTII